VSLGENDKGSLLISDDLKTRIDMTQFEPEPEPEQDQEHDWRFDPNGDYCSNCDAVANGIVQHQPCKRKQTKKKEPKPQAIMCVLAPQFPEESEDSIVGTLHRYDVESGLIDVTFSIGNTAKLMGKKKVSYSLKVMTDLGSIIMTKITTPRSYDLSRSAAVVTLETKVV
jgi:hypothetical protein